MSSISRLELHHLRNISELSIEPSPGINIIYGDNGSGKTSILEAIYLLALGRSFRSTRVDSLIQWDQEEAVVFASLGEGASLGVRKSKRQGHSLRINGEKQRGWLEVARLLPLQILNSDAFQLLEGSPRLRRRFLDWGVFHVEHDFISVWRDSAKCLAQRNLLLKQGRFDQVELQAWDLEFARLGEEVDSARRRYFEAFLPYFQSSLQELLPLDGLHLSYYRGWDESKSLIEVLAENRDRDRRYAASQSGPQRADIRFRLGRYDAGESLSRGQQKMVVSALKIAQGKFLTSQKGLKGVYLLDDLPAELDAAARGLVCSVLEGMGCQVFLSCIEPAELDASWSSSLIARKFHVEHGKIRPRH